MTKPNQPRGEEGKPASADVGLRRTQPVSADQDASGLGPGAKASYRGDAPQRHRPARNAAKRVLSTPGTCGRRPSPTSSIGVAGIGTAPMSTTEYQQAVEAIAVMIARHDAPHAEAA